MKTIEKLEQIKKQNVNLNEIGINSTFYWAYRTTFITNNETIDFDDVIWDKDVEQIINHCKEFSIPYITISSNYSSVIQVLGLFEDFGCKVTGLKKVKSQHPDFQTGELKTTNAIIVSVPQR